MASAFTREISILWPCAFVHLIPNSLFNIILFIHTHTHILPWVWFFNLFIILFFFNKMDDLLASNPLKWENGVNCMWRIKVNRTDAIRFDSILWCNYGETFTKILLYFLNWAPKCADANADAVADVCFCIEFVCFGSDHIWAVFYCWLPGFVLLLLLQITVLLVELILFCNQSHVFANAFSCNALFFFG